MKGSLAEELYSESLKLPKLELDSGSNAENKVSDFQGMASESSKVDCQFFFPCKFGLLKLLVHIVLVDFLLL